MKPKFVIQQIFSDCPRCFHIQMIFIFHPSKFRKSKNLEKFSGEVVIKLFIFSGILGRWKAEFFELHSEVFMHFRWIDYSKRTKIQYRLARLRASP